MFLCGWRAAARPESSLFRFSGSVCVLPHFFFDAIRRDERARHGGAAWLASCAPVSHRPSQRLPFTEVPVTADLLSHFDLTVASEGARLEATAKSHLLVAQNARASILKKKENTGIP